jgi:hypothetical protein
MARTPPIKVSLQAQLVAVRRACGEAALQCPPPQARPNIALPTRAETYRDTLARACVTLQRLVEAREALALLPDEQADRLALSLVAGGMRVVRDETVTPMPVEARHG